MAVAEGGKPTKNAAGVEEVVAVFENYHRIVLRGRVGCLQADCAKIIPPRATTTHDCGNIEDFGAEEFLPTG